MGYYSHGTAHSFLGSAEGIEFMRGWKLNGPIVKTVDQLKSFLVADMAGLEWEVLENDVEGEHAGGPSGGGPPDGANRDMKQANGDKQQPGKNTTRTIGDGGGDSNSQMGSVDRRTKSEVPDEDDDDNDQETRRILGGDGTPQREKSGTSGWMKLRSRS